MKRYRPNPFSRLIRGRFQFTDTGRAIFIGTCFILLATLAVPAFGISGSLVVLQVIGLLLGLLFRPRLDMEGAWPQRIMAGETIQATFVVRNRSRFNAYQLLFQLEEIAPAFESLETTVRIPLLRAGATHKVTLRLRCRQRGRYNLPKGACSSSFPFNLYRFGIAQHQVAELLVVPAYFRLHCPTSAGIHTASHGSRHTRSALGLSVEYLGNRPFMQGDSPHHIDSRAWARLATPAIKEFYDETQQHVAIWYDPWIDHSGSTLTTVQTDTFEAGIQLAASLVYSLNREVVLGHLLLGSQHYVLTEGSLTQRIDRAHDLLATLTTSDRPAEDTCLHEIIEHVDSLDELYIIAHCWNSAGQNLVDYANRAGVKVTLLRVAAPAQPDTIPSTHWPPDTQWIAPDQIHQREVTIW
jgi:uncharacterized protein (DUF58 family)